MNSGRSAEWLFRYLGHPGPRFPPDRWM